MGPMARKPTDTTTTPDSSEVDLNEIVGYNFRLARELKGWTQEQAAIHLEPYLGQRLPQTSISAIEHTYQGGDRPRREFDAHELLAFALAFDLPLVWFLLPPEGDRRLLQRAHRRVNELYEIVMRGASALERPEWRSAGKSRPMRVLAPNPTLPTTPSATRRNPRLPGVSRGGRYWDRTSDLCRVKAALSR